MGYVLFNPRYEVLMLPYHAAVGLYLEDVLIVLLPPLFLAAAAVVVGVQLAQDVLFAEGDVPVHLQALEHPLHVSDGEGLHKGRVVLLELRFSDAGLLLAVLLVYDRLQLGHYVIVQHFVPLVEFRRQQGLVSKYSLSGCLWGFLIEEDRVDQPAVYKGPLDF